MAVDVRPLSFDSPAHAAGSAQKEQREGVPIGLAPHLGCVAAAKTIRADAGTVAVEIVDPLHLDAEFHVVRAALHAERILQMIYGVPVADGSPFGRERVAGHVESRPGSQ